MKKSLLIYAVLIFIIVAASPWGMSANQGINVYVPASAVILITAPNVTFNYPSIDTWTGDTNTQTSNNFYVMTFINTRNNPDMVISSSAITENGGGATIPLSGLQVYVTPQWGTQTSRTLDQVGVFPNVGAGLRFTLVHYDLTINAEQQAGTYTGIVTYSLVNT